MGGVLSDVAWRITAKFDWILQDKGAAASLIGALVTVIGLFVALVPVYFALRQNRAEREWRRSEVVRSLLTEIIDNANIALIARILDWREGPALIPTPFLPLFGASAPPHERPQLFFEIEWTRFIKALPVDRTGDEWREPDLFMYRTCFDSFCAFIQSVADDVRTIGARESEYADLSFYCFRVVFPKNALKQDVPADALVMRRFIESYYNKKTYDVILRHAELYAITHPSDNLQRASTDFPKIFHYRSLLGRVRQRRNNMACVSPRDIRLRRFTERRRYLGGFRSYRHDAIFRAKNWIENFRWKWRKRYWRLRTRYRWLRR